MARLMQICTIFLIFSQFGCAQKKESHKDKATKMCLKHDGPAHANKRRIICNDGSRFDL